ncbi:MAG: hydroxymethylglutaryl-CoA synthase family protein [Promethearchaeota archaeon]|nr:MAG: hydroxymethylglutaryl-CoA synthase family protein [Candidatus Lokiarchaeota archaeon]
MGKHVGISAMGFYIPRHYIAIEKLLEARGEDPAKATRGLGLERMAILASNEDSISMAANAVENLDFDRDRVGKLIFATECGCDSAKDNATYLHELAGLSENCEAYDIKAACAAGTYAVWQVIDWILSGRGKGKLGIVVCSDKAVYEYQSSAEITGGGGAVALLVEEEPQILRFNFEAGDYKRNVRDFWKPLGCECAIVADDGVPSVTCYLEALAAAYSNYLQAGGSSNFDYLVFHTPYSKMVHKAFNALADLIPEIKGKFESMTAGSLKVPSLVGNIYNGALYLALASLLEQYQEMIRGKKIGFYSFGSGCSSKFFTGIVQNECNPTFNLLDQLKRMKPISPKDYERYRQGDLLLQETQGFLLNGVDQQQYRVYTKK